MLFPRGMLIFQPLPPYSMLKTSRRFFQSGKISGVFKIDGSMVHKNVTRGPTCCLQDNFFNFFRMASTTLRLVDYDFQRFQDRFDYSSDYWLVDHDLKKFPRCARPVSFIKSLCNQSLYGDPENSYRRGVRQN